MNGKTVAACIDAAQARLKEHAEEIEALASFLGERSRGHIGPGARSSQLMIAAVCAQLAQAA